MTRVTFRACATMVERVLGVPHPVASMVMATVILAALLGVVVGAAPATEPSAAAAPASVEDSGCLRPLPDVIWGFLVTFLACAVADWGYAKHIVSESGDKVRLLFTAVFVPVLGLWTFIVQSLQTAVFIWRCYNLFPSCRDWYGHLKMLRKWVSPFSLSQVRILLYCRIVVYVPKESPLLQEEWLWAGARGEDLSEAMVIGEVADGKHYERKELSFEGTITLLFAGVAPEYDELKFLHGNSGFAMIALAIQALGYIYAIFFQVGKDLPVAPLEVIGLILNIILLIEVSVSSFFNPCHRPLAIYINSWREKKMISLKMSDVKEIFSVVNWMEKLVCIVYGVVCIGLGGIVIYFIVSLSKASSILVVIPLIIFVVANIMCIISFHLVTNGIFELLGRLLLIVGILLSIVAYTWAFVVTIVYWKSQHFNARAELLNVSQLIPFIG